MSAVMRLTSQVDDNLGRRSLDKFSLWEVLAVLKVLSLELVTIYLLKSNSKRKKEEIRRKKREKILLLHLPLYRGQRKDKEKR